MTKTDDTLRITNQYRDKDRGGAMAYELRCGDARIVLRAARSAADDSNEWRFEAHTFQSPDLVVIGDWQPSRIAALAAIGSLWSSKAASLGLPTFDWTAMATALSAVRAI
jgi:hypothetical protein